MLHFSKPMMFLLTSLMGIYSYAESKRNTAVSCLVTTYAVNGTSKYSSNSVVMQKRDDGLEYYKEAELLKVGETLFKVAIYGHTDETLQVTIRRENHDGNISSSGLINSTVYMDENTSGVNVHIACKGI